MTRITLPTSGLLLGLLFAAPAYAEAPAKPGDAQQAPRPDAASDTPADVSADIVVTATRVPTAIERVAASVTVLDKAAIDRSQDIGVTELLQRTPGVSVSRNGGYGTNTSLRIRGAETDQTVVVIDGVKLNDPASPGGGYNFANLLTGDPLEGSFDVEAGSRDTVSARAAPGRGRAAPGSSVRNPSSTRKAKKRRNAADLRATLAFDSASHSAPSRVRRARCSSPHPIRRSSSRETARSARDPRPLMSARSKPAPRLDGDQLGLAGQADRAQREHDVIQ
eukprot:gene22022-23047_t